MRIYINDTYINKRKHNELSLKLYLLNKLILIAINI